MTTSSPPVAARAEGRGRTLQWSGTDVSVAAVLGNLGRLRVEAAHIGGGGLDHPHPSSSVLNMVVVTDDAGQGETAAAAMATVAQRHPCRAIVLLGDPAGSRQRMDAWIVTYVNPTLDGAMCQYEQVFLRVIGRRAAHVPSLVSSLLTAGVPTVIWWAGAPPVSSRRFTESLDMADVLLLDSDQLTTVPQLFDLARTSRTHDQLCVADLAWARLRNWRDSIAQFHAVTMHRGLLDEIAAVTVVQCGGGPVRVGSGALLVGWLAGALGWTPRSSRGGAVGFRDRSGRSVATRVTRMDSAAETCPDLESVIIEGPRFRLEVKREPGGSVRIAARVDAESLPERVVSLEATDLTASLARVLSNGVVDPVYARSLQATAAMHMEVP